MNKVTISICILFAAIIAQAMYPKDVATSEAAPEAEGAYIAEEEVEVQLIIFEPLEIKANVTFLDFTEEPPMEITVDPKALLKEE